MPSTQCHSYDLNFMLEIVAEAEAVKNNLKIAREYRISKSMVRKRTCSSINRMVLFRTTKLSEVINQYSQPSIHLSCFMPG